MEYRASRRTYRQRMHEACLIRRSPPESHESRVWSASITFSCPYPDIGYTPVGVSAKVPSTTKVKDRNMYMNGYNKTLHTKKEHPLYLFLSSFHFHIFPSHLFLSPFRSSGTFSSSTHPFSLTFLGAPLPIIPFVVSSLCAAIRSCLTLPSNAESSVRRSRRCVRSVSASVSVVRVASGFSGFELDALGSAHPRSTVSSTASVLDVGVESTSSHCSTACQPIPLTIWSDCDIHSSLPSTNMTWPEGAALPFPFL
jgi:hypothetical protein